MYPKTLPVSSGTTIKAVTKPPCSMLGLAQTFLVNEWIQSNRGIVTLDCLVQAKAWEKEHHYNAATTTFHCFSFLMWKHDNHDRIIEAIMHWCHIPFQPIPKYSRPMLPRTGNQRGETYRKNPVHKWCVSFIVNIDQVATSYYSYYY